MTVTVGFYVCSLLTELLVTIPQPYYKQGLHTDLPRRHTSLRSHVLRKRCDAMPTTTLNSIPSLLPVRTLVVRKSLVQLNVLLMLKLNESSPCSTPDSKMDNLRTLIDSLQSTVAIIGASVLISPYREFLAFCATHH